MQSVSRSPHSFALLALALVACDPKPAAPPSTTAPAKELRGQAIQSLPTAAATATASNPAAIITPAAPIATAPEKIGDYLSIGFDRLAAFNYDMPEDVAATNAPPAPVAPKDQIPAIVRAFNNQKVAVKGFMLPLKVEGGLVTELLIMRDQSACCYGAVPKINEWVSVKMAGKGVKPIMDQPVLLFGKLQVGEIRENGYLVGIYQMDGDKLGGPTDL